MCPFLTEGLNAVCDLNEGRVKSFSEKYGVEKIYTDYNEMFKLKELDAISVCTWNNGHAPVTIAALNAGKHVLCEKPMALNALEADKMANTSLKSGKLLMVGFVRRFGRDEKVIKDFIDRGILGDIYYSKACYLRRCGNPGGWFSDIKRSGGGALIDLGVHVIDLIRYLVQPSDMYESTIPGRPSSEYRDAALSWINSKSTACWILLRRCDSGTISDRLTITISICLFWHPIMCLHHHISILPFLCLDGDSVNRSNNLIIAFMIGGDIRPG